MTDSQELPNHLTFYHGPKSQRVPPVGKANVHEGEKETMLVDLKEKEVKIWEAGGETSMI